MTAALNEVNTWFKIAYALEVIESNISVSKDQSQFTFPPAFI